MTPSWYPAIAVAIPAVAALAILRTGRWPNVREACTLSAAVLLVGVVAINFAGMATGAPLETTLVEMLPGVALRLRADAFGTVFAMLASVLWLVTSVYSIGYMRGLREHAQTRYFASFAAALSATIGVAFSANLLTLYLFYELLTFATYPLVVHKETEAAVGGGP